MGQSRSLLPQPPFDVSVTKLHCPEQGFYIILQIACYDVLPHLTGMTKGERKFVPSSSVLDIITCTDVLFWTRSNKLCRILDDWLLLFGAPRNRRNVFDKSLQQWIMSSVISTISSLLGSSWDCPFSSRYRSSMSFHSFGSSHSCTRNDANIFEGSRDCWSLKEQRK